MNGRVLVTGIGGFTGPYIRSALESVGFEVSGISERAVTGSHDSTVDLLDRDALLRYLGGASFDYVIHLAGVSFVAHESVADQYRINLLGTANLIEGLLRVGMRVKKVVLASSANVYGVPRKCPVDESAETIPVNHYGVSKLAVELMARIWASEVPIQVARPFNYTGRGQSPRFVVPKIVEAFRRRSADIELGDLDPIREFMDVRDVAQVYVKLMQAATTETVNICCGQGYSLRDLLALVEKISGHTPRIAATQSLKRQHEIPELVGSPAKLFSAIGPQKFRALEETLRWMLAEPNSSERVGGT